MIEILQHGSIGYRIREFRCPACGCRFLAGPTEYTIHGRYGWVSGSTFPDRMLKMLRGARCGCPDCGVEVLEVECERGDALAAAAPTPPHGRLVDEREVILAVVSEGMHDPQFKIGDIIKYSPSEIAEILKKRVPTVIEAEEVDI